MIPSKNSLNYSGCGTKTATGPGIFINKKSTILTQTSCCVVTKILNIDIYGLSFASL